MQEKMIYPGGEPVLGMIVPAAGVVQADPLGQTAGGLARLEARRQPAREVVEAAQLLQQIDGVSQILGIGVLDIQTDAVAGRPGPQQIGQFRAVAVKVGQPGLRVRTRGGYVDR